MDLVRHVYASRAACKFSPEGVQDLARIAAERNAKVGITGLLIYGSGNFLQLLEGQPQRVEALFQRIHRDVRHDSVITILREPIATQIFPKWNMGVVDLANPRTLSPYSLQAMTRLAKSLGTVTNAQFIVSLINEFRSQLGVEQAAA